MKKTLISLLFIILSTYSFACNLPNHKVKIITSIYHGKNYGTKIKELEDNINYFIRGKSVCEIKYQTPSSCETIAFIIYHS